MIPHPEKDAPHCPVYKGRLTFPSRARETSVDVLVSPQELRLHFHTLVSTVNLNNQTYFVFERTSGTPVIQPNAQLLAPKFFSIQLRDTSSHDLYLERELSSGNFSIAFLYRNREGQLFVVKMSSEPDEQHHQLDSSTYNEELFSSRISRSSILATTLGHTTAKTVDENDTLRDIVLSVEHYIPGDELQKVAKDSPLDFVSFKTLFHHLFFDVERYLHDRKHICHRDLHTRNILIEGRGDQLKVHLLDANLATLTQDDKGEGIDSFSMTFSGNEHQFFVAHLPPEIPPPPLETKQYEKFYENMDAWQMGATLLHALLGQSAFHVEPDLAQARIQQLGQWESLCKKHPELEGIIQSKTLNIFHVSRMIMGLYLSDGTQEERRGRLHTFVQVFKVETQPMTTREIEICCHFIALLLCPIEERTLNVEAMKTKNNNLRTQFEDFILEQESIV